MSEPETELVQEARRILARLDAMDFDGLRAMLTDDVQGVDEISRRWMRGRGALEEYFSQLESSVGGVHSQLSDVHASAWGDVGLVTSVLDQTYTLDGEEQKLTAPTSILFRREGDEWKVALIHTVPLPDAD